MDRSLLLISCVILSIEHSLGKSVSVDLNLAPEWKAEITKRASDYVQHIILPFVAKELNDLSVPNIDGNIKTPLGDVQYDLSKIKLSNVVIQKSNMSLIPEHGLKLLADHASGNVEAAWHYKESAWPHISDSGTCVLSVKDLSLGMAFYVDGDLETKDAKVSAKDCSINIGTLHVKFKGGASWLYNMFADGLASHLKDQLTKQICDAAINMIDAKATKTLNTFPMIMRKFATAYMH